MPVYLQTTPLPGKEGGTEGSPNLAASAVSPHPAVGLCSGGTQAPEAEGQTSPGAGAASQTATPTAARDLKTAGELPDKRPLL